MAYAFMLDVKPSQAQNEMKSRKSILLDGVHHARELTTISQVLYTMLELLHAYENGQTEAIELLKNSAVIFIPMVNPDGVALIDDYYKRTGQFEYIRKNRHVLYQQGHCKPEA